MNPVLEVAAPGLLTTVQDAGRPGLGHLGVPRSGACDSLSLAVANGLVGNDPGAAALELTLVGPELRVLASCVIGLAGSDLGGIVQGSGRRLLPGRSHRLSAGEVVGFPGPAGDATGARAYIALPGGLEVPLVLSSRSTCLVAGFGGLEGRPLREGDRLRCARPADDAPDDVAWPSGLDRAAIRLLPGPDPSAIRALTSTTWSVSPASDRMGLRLEGPPIAVPHAGGERRSHGVVPGTVQLPPDGRPIVLLVDAQPTGGYPVPAVVATVDLPRLGQLGPGAHVEFRVVSRSEAVDALRKQHSDLRAGLDRLKDAGRWEDLWRSARG